MPGNAAPAPTEVGFAAAFSRRAKRRLGIDGRTALVRLAPDGIEVCGDRSGCVLLPFSRIARMRVGFEESRTGTVLLLRLWLSDESKPYLFGGNVDCRAYGGFVRAAVARILRDAPAVAIETGSGLFVPIFVIGAFATLALGVTAFTIHLAATGDDWTIGLGALAVFLILLTILGPWVWSRHRPRRIARVEEIERALPGC